MGAWQELRDTRPAAQMASGERTNDVASSRAPSLDQLGRRGTETGMKAMNYYG